MGKAKNHSSLKQFLYHFFLVLNVVLMCAPFAIAWYTYFNHHIAAPFWQRGNYLMVVLYVIMYSLFANTYDAFWVSNSRVSELVYSQMLAAGITEFLMFIVIALLGQSFSVSWPVLLLIPIQLGISVAWSYFVRGWYFRVFPAHPTIIVWEKENHLEDEIRHDHLERNYRIVGKYQTKQCIENLSLLDCCDTVFLAGVHSHDRNAILKYCVEHNITAYVMPRIGDIILSGAKRVHMFHVQILRVQRYHPPFYYLLVKRIFDIIFSLFFLVLLSPLMLVISLLIRRDGGPAFYRQKRLTKDGRSFEILKFRSMRVDAEKDGVARLSTGENDDRITPIGKWIRKVRLDELPQLINILKGDMTIVGPRPERPEIVAEYQETLPEFNLRLQAKAGLTGLAQVYGKYNTKPYDKLQMDLMYISNPSLIEDIRIIFMTLKILFLKESTEGVAEGQITAGESKESDRP